MQYRLARVEDIEKVLELHFRYQVDSIKEEDKKDGFVTTAFSAQELSDLIHKEKGLFIATEGETVLAFLVPIVPRLCKLCSRLQGRDYTFVATL